MQIDQKIKNLKEITDRHIDPETFIFDFLRAFNISKSAITRAREGRDRNMTKLERALLLTDKMFFSPVVPDLAGKRTLEEALEEFRVNKVVAKKKQQFFVVTDFNRFLAFDSKEAIYADTYNVNLPKLESLLHRFFDHAAVIVQVTDTKGYIQTPKECSASASPSSGRPSNSLLPVKSPNTASTRIPG